MIYPFTCPNGHYEEFVRPVSECSDIAVCPKCNLTMRRIYTAPMVKVNESVFNPALGKFVGGNSGDLKDCLKRYKDTNGSELVEVGNEIDRSKPKLHDYSLSREEMAGVERILENAESN